MTYVIAHWLGGEINCYYSAGAGIWVALPYAGGYGSRGRAEAAIAARHLTGCTVECVDASLLDRGIR